MTRLFGLSIYLTDEGSAWAVVVCDACGESFDLYGPLDLADALTPHVESHLPPRVATQHWTTARHVGPVLFTEPTVHDFGDAIADMERMRDER